MDHSHSRLVRLALIFVVLVSIVGCDQVTKHVARVTLTPGVETSYLNGLVRIVLAHNTGAFLSLGARLPAHARLVIFSIGVGIAVVVGLFYLCLNKHVTYPVVVAGSLVLAGGIGNLIDRVVFSGVVTDFVLLSLGALHTGVFNVADVAVMCGVGLFIFEQWRARDTQKLEKNATVVGKQ